MAGIEVRRRRLWRDWMVTAAALLTGARIVGTHIEADRVYFHVEDVPPRFFEGLRDGTLALPVGPLIREVDQIKALVRRTRNGQPMVKENGGRSWRDTEKRL
jgi:hypothetical protein